MEFTCISHSSLTIGTLVADPFVQNSDILGIYSNDSLDAGTYTFKYRVHLPDGNHNSYTQEDETTFDVILIDYCLD